MSNEKTAKRLVLVNTSVISNYGSYEYKPIALDDARALVLAFLHDGNSVESAIGHQSTADLLSIVLNYQVPLNRTEFKQSCDDLALVFKLKQRPPEGKVLNRQEMEAIGYEFGLLSRIA
jgi:hypothetical protein